MSGSHQRVCAILPALDEAEAHPGVLAARPPGLAVIVADNGSTDDTAEVARHGGARLVHEPRRGFGSACLAGLRAAEEYDVVVYLDADRSLAWEDFDRVSALVIDGSADLVLGARRKATREPGSMPWHAAVANALLGRLCGRLAGRRLHDIGPYRAIRRDSLLALGMRDRGYGWPLEMILRAGRSGLLIGRCR